jgi:hypothetical protein
MPYLIEKVALVRGRLVIDDDSADLVPNEKYSTYDEALERVKELEADNEYSGRYRIIGIDDEPD